MNGVVKCFHENKAFGFIEQENGPYVFVHFSSINCTGSKNIQEGDQVNFDIGGGKKDPAAVNLDVVKYQ